MVVSIANITPSHGSRYYAQEGYTPESEQTSKWRGRLTQVLGLTVGHPVETEMLACLLQGKTTTGTILINKTRLLHEQRNAKAGGITSPTERAGIDLTVSAPKSISIQSLIFGDRALEQAHQQAIAQMLEILEERYAMTRITVNGKRQKLITGKLLIAQFQHTTSRALDPQLHTHNLILNLTQRPDGKWQCLDNEAIYRTKMLLGMIYRNELAREVQALGYPIQITRSQHGLWELQGFSTQQLTQFSKRAEQIKKVSGEEASSERKAKATIFSGRAKKQTVSSDQLAASWQQQAEAAGIQAIKPGEPPIHPLKRLWDMAQELVHQAISFCSRIAKTFCRETIERAALRAGMGQTSFATITQAIDQSPELIAFRDHKQRIRYTIRGDSSDASIQNTAKRPTQFNESPAQSQASTIGNDLQPAQTSIRRLFATLHIQPNRQATTHNDRSKASDVDCRESCAPGANQSIDEAASATTQRDDDVIRAVDDDAFGTDCFLEQPGLEFANSNREDPAGDAADEPAAAQFQPDSAADWEPSL